MRSSTPFTIFNSLNKSLERLTTSKLNVLKWYLCGPTVYDLTHIGHARYIHTTRICLRLRRTYVSFDICRRLLLRYGGGLQVDVLMGITDIDDKIIAKANALDVPYQDVSRQFEADFLKSLEILKVVPSNRYVRVSEHIEEIIQMILLLLERGIAYISLDKSVYFSVDKYRQLGYQYPCMRPNNEGAYSTHTMVASLKCDRSDFALWKSVKSAREPHWDSPWGFGRPGWHIECSAMIHAVFGDEIDLHGGGIDLKFPHHENEIAQSQALSRNSPWCPFFIHTGHLTINAAKMSKSLGNYISVSELLKDWTADDFRMLCLNSHYRDALSFSPERMIDSTVQLRRIRQDLKDLSQACALSRRERASKLNEHDLCILLKLAAFNTEVERSVQQDFDWPNVYKVLFVAFLKEVKRYSTHLGTQSHPLILMNIIDELQSLLGVFGFHSSAKQDPPSDLNEKAWAGMISEAVQFRSKVRSLGLKQLEAGASNEASELLSLCDQFRENLSLRSGVILLDDRLGGTSWKRS